MRKLKIALWLEGYAVLLALLQVFNGVRTDEAKYLLNIPYPHPPLARWLLSLFDGFAWQEIGARILLATLMVQAVWIVWDMGRSLGRAGRLSVSVLWLCSAAFVLQAGTVMMAPITALQALLFLWILSLPPQRVPHAPTVGFLWLATLFTALQGVLLLPLAVAALRMRGASWKTVCWYAAVPLALVALYAAGNPLTIASFAIQSGKDAADSPAVRLAGLAWILVLAGSGVGTLIGLLGLALKKHAWILASFFLVAAYVFLGRFDYYAILFLPFYVTGAKHLLRRMPRLAVPAAAGIVACTAVLLSMNPFLRRHPAEEAIGYVLEKTSAGTTVLLGEYGHEWQYELSPRHRPRRATGEFGPDVSAVVCRDACERPDDMPWSLHDVENHRIWMPLLPPQRP